jgi:hypothetical protein
MMKVERERGGERERERWSEEWVREGRDPAYTRRGTRVEYWEMIRGGREEAALGENERTG